jgi:WD40 repeat protein
MNLGRSWPIGWRNARRLLTVILLVAVVSMVGSGLIQQNSSFWPFPTSIVGVSAATVGAPEQTIRPPKTQVKHSLKAPYSVFSIVFSPDGKQLASGGILNRTVSIWDVAIGKLVRELSDAAGSVESLAYSPDGKYLASGRGFVGITENNISVVIWDAQTGQLVQSLKAPVQVPTAHAGAHNVKSVVFSPDSKYLAVGYKGNAIVLYEANTGAVFKVMSLPKGITSSLGYSPDGRYLAHGSWEADRFPIKIHEVGTGQLVHSLTGHKIISTSLAFSPNGEYLASGSIDDTIGIYALQTGKLEKTLTDHSGHVEAVAYSPQGNYLASGSQDKTVKIWNGHTYELLATIKDHGRFVQSVAFSADGRTLAAGGQELITIWDLN